MDFIIKRIDKMKPFFVKVSRNVYLRAIRDGFISAMPVILFSSIFLLIVNVPNVFGFYFSDDVATLLMKPYDYSMGIIGFLVASTTAKSLTDSLNRDMGVEKQMNAVSTMLASSIGFLLLTTHLTDGAFAKELMGTTGLLSSFFSAFVVVNVYRFSLNRNLTIKMPEEVPPNISQTFADIIPFGLSVLVLFLMDTIVRATVGISFGHLVLEIFKPLFTAADGYFGLALIYGAMAFFWFLGIHGPSIVEPAIAAIAYSNIEANLQLYNSGQHPHHVVTTSLQNFVATLGGTGATFVLPYLLIIFAKSKQLKTLGKASVVPVSFGVNEPILFGMPIVLNPIFFVPFIVAPILNVWIVKIAIDIFKMNGFMYVLPWTTPGPIGIVLASGVTLLSLIVAVLLLVVDAVLYYPFIKIYDAQLLEEEAMRVEDVEQEDEAFESSPSIDEEIKVLVLCAGAGTSGLLANTLNKGAKEHDLTLHAAADSYGNHMDRLKEFNMVILAPQVATNYEDMKKDTDALGIQLVSVGGAEYIKLTRNVDLALKFVYDEIEK
ncbi:MAG TPA: lactose/cellobiose PTS transporter subunit IIB [Erysipelothrix sp.]|nr:lactose/cellobiose PTS transporter subunit IIB [Erysipelothrix sp.]